MAIGKSDPMMMKFPTFDTAKIAPTGQQHGWQQQLSDPYYSTGGNGANHGVKHGAQKTDAMLLLDPTFGTNPHHNSGQVFTGPAQHVGWGPGASGSLNIGEYANRGQDQALTTEGPSKGNPLLNLMMMMMSMMMKLLGMGNKDQPQ